MNRARIGFVLATAAGLLAVQAIAHASPRSRIAARAIAVKPNETIVLDGGEKVSAAQYSAELNQLQEALEREGVSLKKSDQRPPPRAMPLYAGAAEEKQRDKAVLAQKIQKLQAIEAGGFAALRRKRAAALKAGTVAPGLKGATKSAGPAPGGGGSDGDDALDVTYDETLGSKKRAAIYVGVALKDTGEKDKVGCDATLDGGVYVFDQKKQLVKLSASGKVANDAVSGGVDLFLLGKSVDGYPKRGSARNVAANKAIAPPPAKMKYGWGPISVNVEGSIAGELRLNAANTQEGPSSAQRGRCTVSAQPTLRASAKASASVNAIAYKVGVDGQIVLLDVKTPLASSVVVRSQPATMTEDFRASVDAVFLDGDVSFWVKTRVPQKGERLWDLDWDQVYRKELFDWDGLRVSSKLASFSGKQTAL